MVYSIKHMVCSLFTNDSGGEVKISVRLVYGPAK